MNSLAPSILAIDISKDHLDTDAWPQVWRRRVGNDAAGIRAIVKEARKRKSFVIFEATSVYDRELIAALNAAEISYHRANPRKAREFAKSAGFLAKTDRVDAAMLTQYGRGVALPVTEPVALERQALRILIDRRAQLVAMRKQEKTRLQQTSDVAIRAEMEAFITAISARIATYDAKIKAHVKAHPTLCTAAKLLTTAPGIALTTAASLLALLPELGHRSTKSIAALVGVAPLARDSGRKRGQRRVWGGRRSVRALLFLAARHAEKHPAFSAFADRLRQAGKPLKKIRIAVARKLLLALNTMIANQRAFIDAPA